ECRGVRAAAPEAAMTPDTLRLLDAETSLAAHCIAEATARLRERLLERGLYDKRTAFDLEALAQVAAALAAMAQDPDNPVPVSLTHVACGRVAAWRTAERRSGGR